MASWLPIDRSLPSLSKLLLFIRGSSDLLAIVLRHLFQSNIAKGFAVDNFVFKGFTFDCDSYKSPKERERERNSEGEKEQVHKGKINKHLVSHSWDINHSGGVLNSA